MCKPTKNVSIVDRSSTFRGYFKYESNVLLCVFLYTELHTTSSRCCKQILAKGSFRRPQLSCGKRRRLRKTHASDAAVCGKIEKILISKKNSQLAAAVWMSLNAEINHPHCLLFFFKKNGPSPASFSFIFGLFKQTSIQFYNKLMWKNVHPVYGAGIWTHYLQTVILLP